MKVDLAERCIREALRIIDSRGVEALSLREVTRRLRVSHQAPYKHFASRDHLLAEIVRRAFESFARYLDARDKIADGESAEANLAAMGRSYMSYASAHPLQYRLMFGTPLPDPSEHPAMMESAQHAFALLRVGLIRMHAESGRTMSDEMIQRDALFVWATLHGLCSIAHGPALDTLRLKPAVRGNIESHAMARIGAALAAAPPTIIDRMPHGQ